MLVAFVEHQANFSATELEGQLHMVGTMIAVRLGTMERVLTIRFSLEAEMIVLLTFSRVRYVVIF
jgi:hypothetical protein